MGGSCSGIETPTPTNTCSSIGQETSIPGFCTLAGVGGDRYRDEYCSLIGAPGEFGNARESGTLSCSYNSCNPTQKRPEGCCKLCCGIIGSSVSCSRIGFTGSAVPCCFSDYNCNSGVGAACYSDGTGMQNTCSDGSGTNNPNLRSIVSPDCSAAIVAWCTGTADGDDYSSDSWLARWTTPTGFSGNTCLTALQKNLFASPTDLCPAIPTPTPGVCNIPLTPGVFSGPGHALAQQMVGGALKHYADNGYQIGAQPGTVGYNPFQDFLYNNVCCPYPSLCQSGLKQGCAALSMERISLSPSVTQYCGCHLPDSEYAPYQDRYNIPAQCSPTCNRPDAIPLTGASGEPIICTSSTCVVDKFTLNLIDAQVGAGINFSQVCGNCSNGGCSCIVADSTTDIVNSSIGGNVDLLTQNCGALTCTQANPSGVGPATITVPCSAGAANNPLSAYEAALLADNAAGYRRSTTLTVVIVLIIVFFIFIGFFYIRSRRPTPARQLTRQELEARRAV